MRKMEISLDALQGFWKQIRSFKTTCFKKFFEIQKSFDYLYDLWDYLNIKNTELNIMAL